MKKFCLFICVLIFFYSCENNDDLATNPPDIPNAVNFDLNDDGFNDIRFLVGPDDVLTDGTVGYAGYVYPLNEALLLMSTSNDNSWIFDNQLNDTIKKAEGDSYTWYPSNLGFISTDDSPEGIWPDEWTISGQKKSNPYYLGIQIRENNDFMVGWLKLEINKKTAKVNLIDQQFTAYKYSVIDK